MQNPSRESDRQAAQQWARDLLSRTDWVILDTETTGLGRWAEVVQIGVIAPDGMALLDTLVRPRGPMDPGALAVHGITEDVLAGAPDYPEVHPRLVAAVRERCIVCYNAAFDVRLLRQTIQRNRLDDLPARWECAMEQYARYRGQWSYTHGSYKWQSLPRPAAVPGAKHSALDDCRATLEVIRAMAEGRSVQ